MCSFFRDSDFGEENIAMVLPRLQILIQYIPSYVYVHFNLLIIV